LNVQVDELFDASVAIAVSVCRPNRKVEVPRVRAVPTLFLNEIVPGSQGEVAVDVSVGNELASNVYTQLAPAGTVTGEAGQVMVGAVVLVTRMVKEHTAVLLVGVAPSLAV
jgi:hypothetical protein